MIVYKNDSSVTFELNVGVDVSSSTIRRIKYRKPNGTTGYWTASLEGTNAIKYTTNATDLDSTGTWKLQAYVENTWKRHGLIVRQEVWETL